MDASAALLSNVRSYLSHDLKNPLSAAWTAAAFIAEIDDGSDPVTTRSLGTVRSALDRAIGKIDDVCAVIELETGARSTTWERVAVADLLRDVEETVGNVEGRGAAVTWPADSTGEVVGDRELIGRALVALVDNALRHGKGIDAPEVRVEVDESGVVFKVQDRGPGLAPGMEQGLFVAFDAPDRRQRGAVGLGLALCRALADTHGGSVGHESREGGGSIFWIRLPSPPVGDLDAVFSPPPP